MRVISYYTENTPYKQEAENLINSLLPYGIHYSVYPIKNKGDWVLNCGEKPSIIYRALEHLKEDVLFLDADAIVCREIPELNYDVPGICWSGPEPIRVASGTIFFPYNEASQNLLEDWIKEQEKYPNKYDQINLQSVLSRHKYINLSHEWVYINEKFTPLNGQPPIIKHTQASRRFKRKVANVVPR